MIERLAPREKIAVALAAVVVSLTVLIAGIILPYRAAMTRLDERIASRQEQILAGRTLAGRIKALQGEVASAERKLQGTQSAPLVSTIEGMIAEIAGKTALLGIRPQPSTPPAGFRQETIEIKLEKIRLEQLVRLLHSIDSAKMALQTESVKMRPRFEDPGLLDVTLVVSSFAKAS